MPTNDSWGNSEYVSVAMSVDLSPFECHNIPFVQCLDDLVLPLENFRCRGDSPSLWKGIPKADFFNGDVKGSLAHSSNYYNILFMALAFRLKQIKVAVAKNSHKKVPFSPYF